MDTGTGERSHTDLSLLTRPQSLLCEPFLVLDSKWASVLFLCEVMFCLAGKSCLRKDAISRPLSVWIHRTVYNVVSRGFKEVLY